jgi:DNA-binding NarL/FixJ family response regulator
MDQLTGRQLAVMRLLGLGMDNAQIARELSCSQRTVKQHISAIFDRLSVRSRLQAGLVAYHYRASTGMP